MFERIKFKDCELDQAFFESLKEDYEDFEQWFLKKADDGCEAYVWRSNDDRIMAFVYIKDYECESVGTLP